MSPSSESDFLVLLTDRAWFVTHPKDFAGMVHAMFTTVLDVGDNSIGQEEMVSN